MFYDFKSAIVCVSHLDEHKFRRYFQDTFYPLCDCSNNFETITHFFLHCLNFHTPSQTLLSNAKNIKKQILSQC